MTSPSQRDVLISWCLLLVLLASSWTSAQAPALPEPKPVGVIGEPAGGGRWPAVAESDASLRTHTLYHPAKLPHAALPLVIWGNGGCRDDGLTNGAFLREVASHGFFVISLGYPRVERGIEPRPLGAGGTADGTNRAPVARARPAPTTKMRPADPTHVAQMFQAIEWAETHTASPGRWMGKIDLSRIAAMGHSCGGLQAIALSADPRIDTSVIFNSGVLNAGPASGLSGSRVTKDQLAKIHAPIAYITGGPTDIAHVNSVDDVSRINHVPVFFAFNQVGHSGTFWSAPHGGEYAQVAAAWLKWQLKGDTVAAQMFEGPQCGLCTNPEWTVQKRKMK